MILNTSNPSAPFEDNIGIVTEVHITFYNITEPIPFNYSPCIFYKDFS